MFSFLLITPEKIVFDGRVSAVSLPTTSGYIQVLQNHVPLVSVLQAGEVLLNGDNGERVFAVSAGFIEVRPGNKVVVLANTAERVEEIDTERAEAARIRARDLLAEKIYGDQEYAVVAAAIEKEFARVRVARRHRSRVSPLGEGVKRNLG